MRTNTSTLPLDVLDMVLASSPDYATLTSAVTVCKTFHRAFQGRAAGIMRDIATNFYDGRDELVREAIRAIRVHNDVRYLNRWAKCDQERFPSVIRALFNDEILRQRALTRDEAKELCKRVEDACALEVLYSTGRKDSSTSGTSLLSESESHNFHLALHRLEIILSLSRKPHAGTLQWCKRETRFELIYRRFSTEQILHIHELFCFLWKCVQDTPKYLHQNVSNAKCATIIIGTTNIMSVLRDPTTLRWLLV